MTGSLATITRVSTVDARFEPREWKWAEANRAAIDANWRKRIVDKPRMFNGKVLLLGEITVSPDLSRSVYFEADFADLIGWIDFGYPDLAVENGFAMGALRGSDGAFICGIMGEHTANAGRIYFPAGTPDRSDLREDGSVDLAGSLVRELVEETGIPETDFQVDDRWIVVRCRPVVAMMRLVTLHMPAEEAAARIVAHVTRETEPELQGVRIVRGPADIDPGAMPLYLQSFFRWFFAQR